MCHNYHFNRVLSRLLSFLFLLFTDLSFMHSGDLAQDSETLLRFDEVNVGSFVNLQAPTGNFCTAYLLQFIFVLICVLFHIIHFLVVMLGVANDFCLCPVLKNHELICTLVSNFFTDRCDCVCMSFSTEYPFTRVVNLGALSENGKTPK